MRILHIIKSLGRGGAETLLPETLALHKRDCNTFHYIYFLPWKDQMVASIRQNGGKVTCLAASNNLALLLRCRAITRYVRENNIDLIHCHLPWAGVAGRIVHRMTLVPTLYTEHNKQERYHWATRWLNRATFMWQDAVVAVSRDVADSIRRNIPAHPEIITIPNGVNTRSFIRNPSGGAKMRRELGIPGDAVVVGTVAVFRFQKRLKEWLEVFAGAERQRPGLVGIIAGDGPLKKEIQEHCQRLGLERKVFMVGLQVDVKPWLSAIDIFLMTSSFEGLPIALLEAMSMECAVASTAAGGVQEVIRNEIDGFTVEVDQWSMLSGVIVRLAENNALRARLAAAGRERVETSFSLARMVRQLEHVYSAVADKTSAAANRSL